MMPKPKKLRVAEEPTLQQHTDYFRALNACKEKIHEEYAQEELFKANKAAKDAIEYILQRSSKTHIPIEYRIEALEAATKLLTKPKNSKEFDAAIARMDAASKNIKPYDFKMSLAMKIVLGIAVIAVAAVVAYLTFPLWAPVAVAAVAWLTLAHVANALYGAVIGLKSALTVVGSYMASSPMLAWTGAAASPEAVLAMGAATAVGTPVSAYYGTKMVMKKIRGEPVEQKGEPDYGEEDDDELEEDDDDDLGMDHH